MVRPVGIVAIWQPQRDRINGRLLPHRQIAAACHVHCQATVPVLRIAVAVRTGWHGLCRHIQPIHKDIEPPVKVTQSGTLRSAVFTIYVCVRVQYMPFTCLGKVVINCTLNTCGKKSCEATLVLHNCCWISNFQRKKVRCSAIRKHSFRWAGVCTGPIW